MSALRWTPGAGTGLRGERGYLGLAGGDGEVGGSGTPLYPPLGLGLMQPGGSAQLTFHRRAGAPRCSQAGGTRIAYPCREAVRTCVFRGARVCICAPDWAEAVFREPGGRTKRCFPKCDAYLNRALQLRHRVSCFSGHRGFGAQLTQG